MSDLTPEVLDELERLEREAMPGRWDFRSTLNNWPAGSEQPETLIEWIENDIAGIDTAGGKLMATLRNHARDLIEAARERDRLDRLLKAEIEDNCEYDTEIRAMCGHVDDQYREPLPDVVQKVVEERDRLRASIDEAITYLHQMPMGIDPEGVDPDNLTPVDAASHVGSLAARVLIEALDKRKDGGQCSDQS